MKRIVIALLLLFAFGIGCAQQQAGNDAAALETANAVQAQASGAVKEFEVKMYKFGFDPAEITVNKGDRVRLKVSSLDVMHGIGIKEYGINKQVPPGETVIVEFTADKSGTFTMFCAVYCGDGHKEQKGRIIVN